MAATFPSDSQQASGIVQLNISNKDGLVTVTPSSQDRFNIKVDRAIEACVGAAHEDRFRQQLTLLFKRLASWLLERPSKFTTAFVTLRDGCLLFLVVTRHATYDGAFEDDLSALDIELANDPDLDLITIHTMAIPSVSEVALAGFVKKSVALEFKAGIPT
jgi:hypothetical protein